MEENGKEVRSPIKQVIVIRKDLGMRRGKEISQGAHSSMAWLTERIEMATEPRPCPSQPCPHLEHDDKCKGSPGTGVLALNAVEVAWVKGNFRKVTCQVSSEGTLLDLLRDAKQAGLEAHLITDAGLTEFNGEPTHTALAIGPDYDEKIDKITGNLKLY